MAKITEKERELAHAALETWLANVEQTAPHYDSGDCSSIKFEGGFSSEANRPWNVDPEEREQYFNLSIETTSRINV